MSRVTPLVTTRTSNVVKTCELFKQTLSVYKTERCAIKRSRDWASHHSVSANALIMVEKPQKLKMKNTPALFDGI